MSFLDRLHGIVTGTYGALQAPFGLVKDIATAPWDDDVNGGVIGVIYKSSANRLGQLAENAFGPEEGLGSVFGAFPEALRAPTRSITTPILHAAEFAYREGVSEPLSTAVTAASLAEAGHGLDWGQAHDIAQTRSLGQSLALAFLSRDILDDVEIEKIMGSDAYEVISGVIDATSRMLLDPTIVGGKALKMTKAKMLGRHAKVHVGLPRVPIPVVKNGKLGVRTFDLGATYETGGLRSMADAKSALKKRGPQNVAARVMQWKEEIEAENAGVVKVTPDLMQEVPKRVMPKGQVVDSISKVPGGWSVRTSAGTVGGKIDDAGEMVDEVTGEAVRDFGGGGKPQFHHFTDEAEARAFASGKPVPEKVYYHGTVDVGEGELRSLQHEADNNLFGPGFYTTENPNIASEYAANTLGTKGLEDEIARLKVVAAEPEVPDFPKKDIQGKIDRLQQVLDVETAKRPAVRRLGWQGDKPPNLVDLEKPLPDNVRVLLERAVEEGSAKNPTQVRWRGLYAELKSAPADTKGSELVRSVMQSLDAEDTKPLIAALQAEGVDGWSHTGGLIMGQVEHPVSVFFDPSKLGVPKPTPLTAATINARIKNLDKILNNADSPEALILQTTTQKLALENQLKALKATDFELLEGGLSGGDVERLANRIRDQLFADHAQGGLISSVLAEAAHGAGSADVFNALRVMLGDGEAAAAITARNKVVAAQLGRIEEGAGEVFDWGKGYLTVDSPKNLVLDAEKKALRAEELHLSRVEESYRAFTEAPRVSMMGEIRHNLKSRTWLYQKGPLSAVAHSVFDMRPIRLVRLSDEAGDVQLARSLRDSPFNEAEALVWRAEYGKLMDGPSREALLMKMENEGWRRLTEGMHPDDAAEFIKAAEESRLAVKQVLAINAPSRKYDAHNRGTIRFEGTHGKMVDLHLPLWATQGEQIHMMQDWGLLRKARHDLESQIGGIRKYSKLAPESLQLFYHYWKPAVLLRAGWPIRVVGDEQLRIIAKIGAMTQLQELAGGVNETLTNRWKRVPETGKRGIPKSERQTYAFGPVKSNRAYDIERAGGTPGEVKNLMPQYVDARANFQGIVGMHEETLLEQMRMGEWHSIAPDNPTYARDWEIAVNGQIGQDLMGRLFLQGKTADEVAHWLRSTPEGRKYARQYPFRTDYKQWTTEALAQIDSYLPTDKLRELALKGRARHTDLEIEEPNILLRPNVHGETLKQATAGSVVDTVVAGTFSWLFDRLGRMPTNRLSRSKYFDHVYRQEAERLVNLTDEFAESQGRMLTYEELRVIENKAREYGLSEVNKLLYNLAEQSQFAHVLRYISPFYMAWQEVLTRWTGLGVENPEFIARMRQIWMAPEKAGLIVDEDGKEIEWDGSADEYGDERYLVFPLHELVKDVPYFKKAPDMKFNKKSFNMLLQGVPGLGPPIQIALNDVIRDRPTLEDSLKKVLPFGVQQDVMDQLLPTTLKRAKATNEGEENRDYLNSKMRIFTDMQVDFNLGKREQPPTWKEAKERANDFWSMRTIASWLLPAQPTFLSPYQMYIDAYRQRKEVEMVAAQAGKPLDETTDAWFLREHGPEYFPLTQSISKSVDGVNPTREAYAARKKYVGLIEQHPELGGLIIGSEGAGEFSYSVYQAQLATKVSAESSDPQRRSLREEEVERGPNVRLAWEQYGKFMDLVDAERQQRGLPNLQVKGANDLRLLKQRAIAALATKYPEWADEFYVRDAQKWKKKIAGMRDIVNADEYPVLQGRKEIQGLAGYLKARDAVVRELKERDAAGGAKTLTASANQDLAQLWEVMKAQMVADNLPFSQLFFRYLEFDPVEV